MSSAGITVRICKKYRKEMIKDILTPLISDKFLNDTRYREGHLRILNALPGRKVLGLHSPDMKEVAKKLTRDNGEEFIAAFENTDPSELCYEEMTVWGLMINFLKCPLERKFEMLEKYVPLMDNWAVCDSYVSHAKWMKKVPADRLLVWIDKWFRSRREFEVRFAVVVSMSYLLDRKLNEVFSRLNALNFSSIVSDYRYSRSKPAGIQSGSVLGPEPYYVRMGVAWLLATALAKHPNETRTYIRQSSLPPDILKLYARKAHESFRTRKISPF